MFRRALSFSGFTVTGTGPFCNPAALHPGAYTVSRQIPISLQLEQEYKPVYAINISLAQCVSSYMFSPPDWQPAQYRMKMISAKLIGLDHARASSAISMAYRAAAKPGEDDQLQAQMHDSVIQFSSKCISPAERMFPFYCMLLPMLTLLQ